VTEFIFDVWTLNSDLVVCNNEREEALANLIEPVHAFA